MESINNPASPFSPTRCEWDAVPPGARLTVREEPAASALTHNDSPDIPYRWSVNPYRGCQHGCAYCYARRTHEYLDLGAGTDFDHTITVKTNIAERLAAELARPRWRREWIELSGVTDAYQPLERHYRLTRQCLEVCVARGNPVGVTTKSALVTRDIDLLAELHRRAAAQVFISATFADDRVARLLEPMTATADARFEALRRIAAAGVPVGVLIAPVIPGLNDRDIPALLTRAAECGATSACFTPVRLPGSVAEVFLTRLRSALPRAAGRIEARIRDLRGGRLNDPRLGCRMEAHGAYWDGIRRLFEATATRVGLAGGQSWRCGPASAAPRPAKQLELFHTDIPRRGT